MLWTLAFWKSLGERALKSFIQGFVYGTGLSMLTTGVADGTGLMLIDVPWLFGLNSGAVLANFSACTSILNPGFTAGQPNEGELDVIGGHEIDEMTTVTGTGQHHARLGRAPRPSPAPRGLNTSRNEDPPPPHHAVGAGLSCSLHRAFAGSSQ